MKKTISINLAGLVYQIDEDAYNLLEKYLTKVKSTFQKQDEQEEILNDIEYRFAELFNENLSSRNEVVTLKHVEDAIATLGEVEEIDEETNTHSTTNETVNRKLFRSTDDKVIAGVLGGLSVYLGVEAIWLRLIFVILAFASVGVPVGLIYIILWVVMPKAETTSQKMQMKGEPININNIQENVKKNLSSIDYQKTGKQIGNGISEVVGVGAKFIAILLGATIVFNVVLFSFVWFFVTFFTSYMGEDFISLIFNHNWQFTVLSFALFFLINIPFLMLAYFLYKAIKGQNIEWGKSFIITIILWFIALFITMAISLVTFKNYKTTAAKQQAVQLDLSGNLTELNINFKENNLGGNLNFSYKKGNWNTSGFSYDSASKLLELNTVFVKLEASQDSSISLIAVSEARGKNMESAEQKLENFSINVEVLDSNTIVFPTTLSLENETKFRAQTLTYILKVPTGTKISFGDFANEYISNPVLVNKNSRKDLANNTWLFTAQGLDCLSCSVE